MSAPPSPSMASDSTVFEPTVVPLSLRTRLNASVPAFLAQFSPMPLFLPFLQVAYIIYQAAIRYLFAPAYHGRVGERRGRVAIIGAGLTGISSAAHLVDAGFEVVIFEASGSPGGIWANVNSTSSLQLNSLLYRFHPSINWSCAFPYRDEIVRQITAVWTKYRLEDSTRFNTKVEKVERYARLSESPAEGGHARWVINDGREGIFDAVIASIGSCGAPKVLEFPNSGDFHGRIVHSSELDSFNTSLAGKKVVIIGSGASGVEAAEAAINKGSTRVVLLARDDKWIIPRNTIFDIMLALQPWGRETFLSFIPEWFIRTFHYRDQKSISPQRKGLFQGTPIVNDAFLNYIRQGLVQYKRGDTQSITSQGIRFVERTVESKAGDPGVDQVETADVIVLATGYHKPSVDMLPRDLFPTEGARNYERPNLYLQNFCTEDWSVLLTNASYQEAIGTVGNWHIGLYTRILIVFLLDPNARPSPKGMKVWVDLINWIKTSSWVAGNVSGLSFFTYLELVIWVLLFHIVNLQRLRWLRFVLFGWGMRGDTAGFEKVAIKN